MGRSERPFGWNRQLPSGKWHASYPDPEGRTTVTSSGRVMKVRYAAPTTFHSSDDAKRWLLAEEDLIESGAWIPPTERAAVRRAQSPTLAEYGPRWVDARKVKGRGLAERTKDHYRDLLDRSILPTFGDTPLKGITPEAVASWYDTAFIGKATTQAHAYGLLRSILGTAADPSANSGRALIPFNPCGIKGGGSSPRNKRPSPPTAEEVAGLLEVLPKRHHLFVLLADGCGLRFGELAELRRSDIDVKNGIVKVRRGVVRTKAGVLAKKPKTDASERDLPIPPHLMPAVREHLLQHTQPGASGLLFPGRSGEHLSPSAFYGRATEKRRGKPDKKGWGWYEARRVIGRPELHFHDLRHGALTEAARNGATLAELMALGGHSTSQAAMLYQASASSRLAELARKRSEALGWAEGAE